MKLRGLIDYPGICSRFPDSDLVALLEKNTRNQVQIPGVRKLIFYDWQRRNLSVFGRKRRRHKRQVLLAVEERPDG